MADDAPNVPSGLFRLGGLTTKLLYWLEVAWFDEEVDETATVLGRVAIHVTAICTLINALPTDQRINTRALNSFITAVQRFFQEYREKWLGGGRKAMLIECQPTEPEHQFEIHQYMVDHSPLKGESWAAVEKAEEELRDSLGPDVRACFVLGKLLYQSNHLTFTELLRTRDPTRLQVYFAVEFNAELARYMARLIQAFPHFDKLNYDLSDLAGPAISQTINELREVIESGLTLQR